MTYALGLEAALQPGKDHGRRERWECSVFIPSLTKGWVRTDALPAKATPAGNIALLRKFAYNLTVLAERDGTTSKKEGNHCLQLFAKPNTVKRLPSGKIPRMSA